MNAPGFLGTASLSKTLQKFTMPWSGPEHLGLYQQTLRILEEVNPLIVAVDPMFSPGLDAVRAQGRNYMVVSPSCLKDLFAGMQPWGSVFWKYPA